MTELERERRGSSIAATFAFLAGTFAFAYGLTTVALWVGEVLL